MADTVIFIGWGPAVHGREERAVEVFKESVDYWGELQAEGRIEKFDVAMLHANGFLNGFAVLYGTHGQFAGLAEDERWQRMVLSASLIVEDLRIIEGFTGDALAHELDLFKEISSRVPAAVG